jgi:hypothetical protein
MDDRLRLIRYLYGEDANDAAVAHRLSEDGDLYREYERLRETKKRLDDRPSPRPDAAVVDRIVETAQAATRDSSVPSHADDDRPPRSPRRTWTHRLQAASAGLALVLLAGLAWWELPGASEESAAVSSTETAQQAAPANAETRDAGTEAVPAWNEREELVRIHRRIERLQTHSTPDTWGTLQRVDRTRP